ncbi:MAG TPA: tRNA lysidine(34) synthetase TilS [Permianibacter sp.]|nr:tRNA lysidine(34) synthetase TilS [Permianibacter sp.]
MTTHAPAEAFASALGALLFSAAEHAPPPNLVVAYSGGRDSTVLLHLAFAFAQKHQLGLRAIHVNHQLQTAAEAFVRHCQHECATLAIPLEVVTLDVARTDKGLEADAREARYAAFATRLQANDILLLGQHADDQLETLLLQLLRGAGPLGLACMPASAPFAAGQLCRPLLSVRREALAALAFARGWRWIDDPSNEDHSLARNRLRSELMPVLLRQREGAAEVLLRAVHWQAESVGLLADLAAIDLATVATSEGLLQRSRLLALSAPRQANLLRHWLLRQGCKLPNADKLQEFLRQLAAASDKVTMQWAEQALRVYGDLVLLMPAWPAAIEQIIVWSAAQDSSAPVSPLVLPYALGALRWQTVAPARSDASPVLTVRAPRAGETVSVRWQTAGLRLALPGRQGRRELKDVFQEARIPAWLRPLWPKLFYNDTLVALPGVLVTTDGQPTTSEASWLLQVEGPLFSLATALRAAHTADPQQGN